GSGPDRDVPVGEHAHQTIFLTDRQQADIQLLHPVGRILESCIGVNHFDATSHDVLDFHEVPPGCFTRVGLFDQHPAASEWARQALAGVDPETAILAWAAEERLVRARAPLVRAGAATRARAPESAWVSA